MTRTRRTEKRSLPTNSIIDTNKQKLSKEERAARDTILDPIIDKLMKRDKIGQGTLQSIVESSKTLLPWLSTNILKCRLYNRRQIKAKQKVMADLTVPSPIPDHSSAMPALLSTNNRDALPTHPIETITLSHSQDSSVISSVTTTTNNSLPSSLDTPPPNHQPIIEANSNPDKKRVGRPIGSTKAAKKYASECRRSAVNEIASIYNEEMKKAKERKTFVKKGTLQRIQEDVKRKRNLPDDFKVARSTIATRIKTGKPSLPIDNRNGPNTPLVAIESNLVKLAVSMAKCRIPLTAGQGLNMINSCIDGTESHKKLIDFKKRIKADQDDSTIGSVSKKYWKKFLARNSDKLELKKAVKYELQRDNFVTYTNFEEMYNEIEDLLVNDAKIAEFLPEPIWMNEKGEEVSELEAVGMKCRIKITHPELGITLDEVGGNTNMMDDGHVGGTLHVVAKGSECQIKASKKR